MGAAMKKALILIMMMLIVSLSYGGQVKADKLYYAWVDKVNVRATPDLNGKVVKQLSLGEDVTYSGKKTRNETTITLNGKEYTKSWAMITTRDGTEGWVHAATLLPKKILVCWLDKVNVRDTPDLKAKAVASIQKNEEVEYLGYITEETSKVELRGKTYNEPFYKVKMRDGKVVWVYGGTVQNKIQIPAPNQDEDLITVGPGGEYSTLQEALDNAHAGMTILIKQGDYRSDVSIRIENLNDITIKATEEVMLICTSQYDDVLTIINSTGITIQNITLKHHIPVTESCSGMVISVNSSRNISFVDCDINGCGWMGIYSYRNEGLMARNCYFHENYEYAINLDSQDRDVLIEGCRIDNNGGGIAIDWSNEISSDDSPYEWLSLRNNEWGQNSMSANEEGYDEGIYDGEEGDGGYEGYEEDY